MSEKPVKTTCLFCAAAITIAMIPGSVVPPHHVEGAVGVTCPLSNASLFELVGLNAKMCDKEKRSSNDAT